MRCVRCPDGPRRQTMIPPDTGKLMVMLLGRGPSSEAQNLYPSAEIGLHLYTKMHIPSSRARLSTGRCNYWPRMVVWGTDSMPEAI